MTYSVVPVSEGWRRVTRVVIAEHATNRFFEILEPEGSPVRAHPSLDLRSLSLADDETLRAAVESLLENSSSAQAQWRDATQHPDIVSAAAEADHLLAPSGMVPRELDDAERQWRQELNLIQQQVHGLVREIPRTPLQDVQTTGRRLEDLLERAEPLVDRFFERPIQARSEHLLSTELARVLPQTHLRDLDLHPDALVALAAENVFTVSDAMALKQSELRAAVDGEALGTLRRAFDALIGETKTVGVGWPKLPKAVVSALEDAGYVELSDLGSATLAEVKALPGVGPKGLKDLKAAMGEAGIAFRRPSAAPREKAPAAAGQLLGRVKQFDSAKGFGFIEREDGGGDIFVHYSAIQVPGYKELQEGQRVEFAVAQDNQGRPKAENVRLR